MLHQLFDVSLNKYGLQGTFPISIGAYGVSFTPNIVNYDDYETYVAW